MESRLDRLGSEVGLGGLDGSNLAPIVAGFPVPPAALRSHAEPPIAPRLPDGLLVVVHVGHSANCGHALLGDVDLALGGHSDDAAVTEFADELRGRASRSGDVASSPCKELHVVHH